MRTITALAVLAVLLLLFACGPDSELVASGRIHSCQIKAMQDRLKTDPQDQGAQTELRDRTELLKTVIETADPGDRSELEAAIQEAVAKGCP